MDLLAPVLKVWVSDQPGVGRVEVDAPSHVVCLGDTLTPEASIDFGLKGPRLTERALALVTLIALEWNEQSYASVFARGPMAQRRRFATQLGMSAEGFSKFVQRTLRRESGRILRWSQMHQHEGRSRSRTGGPWWLAVREATIEPNAAVAKAFIKAVRDKSVDRGQDPHELFREALAVRAGGDWVEALGLLESLAERFRTRKWRRNDPLWFEILLTLSGTEMQLGEPGLRPALPQGIRTSISVQKLRGPEFDLIAARAHYIAALIYNQADDGASAPQAFRELRLCRERLDGRRDPDALDEFWKAASYEEIQRSRKAGVAAPQASSAILEAGQVVDAQRDQNRMRYGETLLYAGRPATGLDYIQSALHSGRMELPGQIIGRRLEAVAKWMLGDRKNKALETLGEIQKDARSFGFAHQVRTIAEAKVLVRQGARSLRPD